MQTLFKGTRKGGVFDSLGAMATGIAVLAIVLVVVFLILAEGQDQIVSIQGINESDSTTFTTAYNASNTLTSAVADVPGWVPIVVIASIGSVLLGLVSLYKR